MNDVARDVEAGKVIGACSHSGGLGIRLVEEDGPGVVQSSNSPAVSVGGIRRSKWLPDQQQHSPGLMSIAFAGDGKVAASSAFMDKIVLVWGAATGTILRKLNISGREGRFVIARGDCRIECLRLDPVIGWFPRLCILKMTFAFRPNVIRFSSLHKNLNKMNPHILP